MSEDRDFELKSLKRKHWGEISPEHRDAPICDVSEDIIKSMDVNCLNEFPDPENVLTFNELILPSMDPLMLYAIQLHKWTNDMTETIRLAELAVENNLIPSADAKPPIPEMPDVPQKHNLNILNFMEASTSSEAAQDDLDIPALSLPIVRKILIKSVATMTAHIGYESTYQSVLDVLADILEQFFVKVCGKFTSALNQEENLDSGGFANVLERVLVDIGQGGAKGLYDYYQCRILKYIGVLQKRCKELDEYYSTLLVPKSDSPKDEIGKYFSIRVKKEENVDDAELHTADGRIFSAGFQLLDSFESASNIQGLSEMDGFQN